MAILYLSELMMSISFRNRILIALLILGAVPTAIGILGWSLALRQTSPVAGRATTQEIGTSARLLLSVVDTSQLSPTGRAALDSHLDEINRALSLANRAVAYSKARAVALTFFGFFLGALLLWAALSLARSLSAQLSRPLDELVGWTLLIRKGESLPPDLPGTTTPEFTSLRTALQETAAELKQGRAAELEAERLRAFREVARRVAHEMKNPLTPVRFAVSQLSTTATPAQQEALEVLRAESARLESLAREFANLGRLPEGPAAQVDLCELLGELARTSVPPEMEVHLKLRPDTPHILGHYDPLHRAFANLIRNAVEASGGTGVLEISVGPGLGGARVTIADHGVGIPVEELPQIFEPYFTRKADGTGLGLALVRQAVEMHRGTVGVWETEGGGATFEVRLPLHHNEAMDPNAVTTQDSDRG